MLLLCLLHYVFGIKKDSLSLIKTVPLSSLPGMPKFDQFLLREDPKSICLKIEIWSPGTALPNLPAWSGCINAVVEV